MALQCCLRKNALFLLRPSLPFCCLFLYYFYLLRHARLELIIGFIQNGRNDFCFSAILIYGYICSHVLIFINIDSQKRLSSKCAHYMWICSSKYNQHVLIFINIDSQKRLSSKCARKYIHHI